jgi:hypothetical protein
MSGNPPSSLTSEDPFESSPQIESERRSRGSRGALGAGAIATCVVSVLLMVTLGLLGPSSTEPVFGPAGKLPPWFWNAHPPDLLVCALVALMLLLGTAAVTAGLVAVRSGWSPSPRALLIGSGFAVAGLLCVPPLGTTDPLNYAAYGRMAALGLDPYRISPWRLAHSGDPIGKLAIAEPWLHLPSVYGPLATATEWAASMVGGTSMLRTVWLLSVLSGIAYVATGALLLRLAGPDPARRVRSQLLWSLNPVLLWNLVAGSHVDVLGAFCVVTAFWALRRSGLTAGLALGAATAIKLTMGVFALPFAWSLRHDWRRLAATASAGILTAAVAFAIAPQVVHNAAQVSGQAVVGSPWPALLRKVLLPVFGTGAAKLTTAMEVTSASVLVILMLVMLPPALDSDITQRAARPALALAAGYLLGTSYVRPWYDAAAWLLLALLVPSWFDLVLLAHTVLMTLTFGPGLPYPLHPHWLTTLIVQIGYRIVPALQALLLLALFVIGIRRIRRKHFDRPRRLLRDMDDQNLPPT